jgi:hypothetical protein
VVEQLTQRDPSHVSCSPRGGDSRLPLFQNPK